MATIKLVLRNDQVRTDGSCQLTLRVVKDRLKKEIALKYWIRPEDWDSVKESPKKSARAFYNLRSYCEKIKSNAFEVLLDYKKAEKPFTIKELAEHLIPKEKINKTTVFEFFEEHIQRKKSQGNIGTASVFKSAYNQFKSFREGEDLEFHDLTPTYLLTYESWLLSKGNMLNSVFNYLRTFKTLINEAKKYELISKEVDPFSSITFPKYRKEKTKKRALTLDQIRAIEKHETKYGSFTDLAKDIFLVSYYCRGINFNDLILLKLKNIKNNQLSYTRTKTKDTFVLELIPKAKIIFDKYIESMPSNEDYIFPILKIDIHKTPIQILNRRVKVLKYVNTCLGEISEELEFPEKFTTYAARHSFATISYHQGKSLSLISQALGHKGELITETYLKQFENKQLDQAFCDL